MRLTDADELKEWVENWFEKNRYYHPHSKANNIPIPELYDILERMPTVDAEPIRHGHWEWNDYGGFGNYHCTVCRYIPYGKFSRKFCPDYMYCPRCGAKMDAPTQKSVGKALKALGATDDS